MQGNPENIPDNEAWFTYEKKSCNALDHIEGSQLSWAKGCLSFLPAHIASVFFDAVRGRERPVGICSPGTAYDLPADAYAGLNLYVRTEGPCSSTELPNETKDRSHLSAFQGLSQPLLPLSAPSGNYKVSALRSPDGLSH